MPLRLLDEVSTQLPRGVWLTALSHSGTKINVSGFAFSNYELVNYVQKLKGSKYLSEVALVESRKEAIGDISVYKFILTFDIKV
ncbi:MAG TPA: hypothetical protein ENG75_03515 [Nitrospirae bacterium]|nr:hypothetical protein [Nitrospirota bacterium]